jgi:hypothetical protein
MISWARPHLFAARRKTHHNWMVRTFRAVRAAFKSSCVAFPHNAIIHYKLAKLKLLFRCKMCFQLVAYRMQLIAKYGCRWRRCVFENEVVEFLEIERDVHDYLRFGIRPRHYGCVSRGKEACLSSERERGLLRFHAGQSRIDGGFWTATSNH